MQDNWEIWDIYKALLAVAAGVILGLERELKDKAAGLKTITVICLGSALFAILSYKIGGPYGEPTRIASYIVSGIGFIGAGVIFKDGINVSGLTTAGIIWLAAAVGTSIGFGEFYLAATFMLASLFIVYSGPLINRIFPSRRQTRTLSFTIHHKDLSEKENILSTIRAEGISAEEKRVELKQGELEITLEIELRLAKGQWLEKYLVNHPNITAFVF